MKQTTTNKKLPIFALVTLSFFLSTSPQADVINATAKQVQHTPDQILVQFKPGTSAAAKNAAHGKDKPTSEHGFKHFDGLKMFKLPPGLDVQTAIEHYKKNPNVLYAEADNIVGLSSTNDTSFTQLWGLNNTGQTVNGTSGTADADMNIVEAWANAGVTGSNSVVIGVIDSGVQYNHPDLANNMWVNPGEIAGNGVDDDSNGYIDDVYGINAITNSGNPMDDNNHGTHVAGTIAAVGDNSQGITGVNQQAKILACKFLNAAGSGSSSDSLKCLDYIYDLKMKGVNIVVTN
ncbi:MAG: S8 family serine peptidase, partial [Gammaproteobacteria bacterium]|nr:S8 family serine peptidase [Gammaproteobacteria bacterium]